MLHEHIYTGEKNSPHRNAERTYTEMHEALDNTTFCLVPSPAQLKLKLSKLHIFQGHAVVRYVVMCPYKA